MTSSDLPFQPGAPQNPPPYPAAPPYPPAAPPYPPTAPSPRRRVRLLLSVLLVLGLVVAAAGATVAVQTYRSAGTPQAVVRAYFAAVARGDAGDALAAGAVPAGGRALVTSDVLRATLAFAPIGDVRMGSPSVRGAAATVPVRYRIGGADPAEVADVVPMRRTGNGWRLARSAIPVRISVVQATTWAAVAADPPFAVPDSDQLAFPGVVPIVFRATSLQVASDTREVRFAGGTGGTTELAVQATVSPAGADIVAKAVRSALTACVQGGAAVDPFCPQPPAGTADGVTFRAVPQSFRGRLTGTAASQELAFDVASAGGDTIRIDGQTGVDGAWQVLDYDDLDQPRSGTATIAFTATVSIGAPGTVVWDRG